MEEPNATRLFLGDEANWAGASIELYDVQALWGGRRIYAEWSKKTVVRLVERGSHLERRYEVALGKDEITRLFDLFVEQDFLTIHPAERPGIPDEARPRIGLASGGGDKREVAKWAGVEDDRFETLYRALLCLEALVADLDPVYVGPYEAVT